VSAGIDQPLGIESKLWAAADKLRGNLDSSEYRGVVLGLIFLKYVSDAFEDRRASLARYVSDPDSEYYMKTEAARATVLESRDEYLGLNVFWVPEEPRWQFIQDRAKLPDIGKVVDSAMDAIEVENPSLRGMLPRDYSRPALDKRRLGELIDDRSYALT
jgi:type I restriction enzyme M protein